MEDDKEKPVPVSHEQAKEHGTEWPPASHRTTSVPEVAPPESEPEEETESESEPETPTIRRI